jgi:hypothetical protein
MTLTFVLGACLPLAAAILLVLVREAEREIE